MRSRPSCGALARQRRHAGASLQARTLLAGGTVVMGAGAHQVLYANNILPAARSGCGAGGAVWVIPGRAAARARRAAAADHAGQAGVKQRARMVFSVHTAAA